MDSPRYALPLLAAGQAQKEVTHNEALLAIDRLLHPVVASRAVTAPPANAAAGEAWIVPAAATGAWAGRTNQIASHDGFGWQFLDPRPGLVVHIVDEASAAIFLAGWSTLWPVGGLAIGGRAVLAAPPVSVSGPVGGITVDAESRTVLNALIAALRSQGLLA